MSHPHPYQMCNTLIMQPESKTMKTITLCILIAAICSGCSSIPKEAPGNHDHLLGWYERRGFRDSISIIPVMKRDGRYFSICRGIEVPLKEVPGGLAWGFEKSSMEGTMIGMEGNTVYLELKDDRAPQDGEGSEYHQGYHTLHRISMPSKLLNSKAKRPNNLDDVLGCYQPVYFPYYRWFIKKVDDGYKLEAQIVSGNEWLTRENESAKLTPLPDRIGFTWGNERNHMELIYNDEQKRYEAIRPDGSIVMPLARIKNPEKETPPHSTVHAG